MAADVAGDPIQVGPESAPGRVVSSQLPDEHQKHFLHHVFGHRGRPRHGPREATDHDVVTLVDTDERFAITGQRARDEFVVGWRWLVRSGVH